MGEWKETGVNKIPAHWDYKSVLDCELHIGDGNYSSKYPRQSELINSGIAFVSSNNLVNGKINSSNLRYISPKLHSKLLKGHIKKDDVLIVVRGNGVGDVALVDKEYEDVNINAQLAFFRQNGEIQGNFLYYQLLNNKNKGLTEQFVSGSAQPQITVGSLKEIELVLPPLPEQKAIASVLSSLDDKIDLLHRQNKTLEAMAETLFRQWFVEEAQEDWEDGCLGDVIELVYGKGLKKELRSGKCYPVVGSSGVVDHHSEYLVEGPGIVIGRKGTLGKVIYLWDNFYPIDTTYYVKSKVESVGLLYEYFLLKTINFEDMNTDSAVPGLNRDIALSTEIKIAPEDKLHSFNEFAANLVAKLKKNKDQIHTLEKLRDTLLPKIMSGEVRISVKEIAIG